MSAIRTARVRMVSCEAPFLETSGKVLSRSICSDFPSVSTRKRESWYRMSTKTKPRASYIFEVTNSTSSNARFMAPSLAKLNSKKEWLASPLNQDSSVSARPMDPMRSKRADRTSSASTTRSLRRPCRSSVFASGATQKQADEPSSPGICLSFLGMPRAASRMAQATAAAAAAAAAINKSLPV
eukprot:scaffold825_cov249-Pinguiococcus_pyrenoidosus.AAC.58